MSDRIDRIINLIFAIRQLSACHIHSKSSNFSFLQFATLLFIKDKKPLMKELADFLDITPPSATSLVETLVNAKLAKRLHAASDRRIIQIVITAQGQTYLKKGKLVLAKKMRKNLENLNQKEQETLSRILAKILKTKAIK